MVELDLPSDPHTIPGDGVPTIATDDSYSWDFEHTPGEGWHYGRERTSRDGAGERIEYATGGARARMSGSRWSTREFAQAYVGYFDFVAETETILFDAVIDIDATLERDTIIGAAADGDVPDEETSEDTKDTNVTDGDGPAEANGTSGEAAAPQAIPIALGTASLLTGLAGLQDSSNHVGFEIGYFMQNLSRGSNLTRDESRGDIYDETLTSDGEAEVDDRFQRRQEVGDLIPGDTYRIGVAYGGSMSGIRRSSNHFEMLSDDHMLEHEHFSVEGR
ncbi:hypothetical protein C483_13860 [Natrialba hulunbeirensis JCM 10989]|uniref:Uncharacterized protein n=2 Tax=Natrialba hulunbeirensis TaxID=123783 RepID=L9ZSJ0_9EURY|nr:hypothetical protein C483_13860 [Natrialba hulunbeirensis JCM 10989]